MDTLVLTGKDLKLQEVRDVAFHGRKAEISDDAFKRLAKGRDIMQKLANEGKQNNESK